MNDKDWQNKRDAAALNYYENGDINPAAAFKFGANFGYAEGLAEIERLNLKLAGDTLDKEWPVLKERDQLRARLAEAEKLVEALKAVQDTICREFCGSGSHHEVYEGPHKALAAWDAACGKGE